MDYLAGKVCKENERLEGFAKEGFYIQYWYLAFGTVNGQV